MAQGSSRGGSRGGSVSAVSRMWSAEDESNQLSRAGHEALGLVQERAVWRGGKGRWLDGGGVGEEERGEVLLEI
jgi:hypothetical protein